MFTVESSLNTINQNENVVPNPAPPIFLSPPGLRHPLQPDLENRFPLRCLWMLRLVFYQVQLPVTGQ